MTETLTFSLTAPGTDTALHLDGVTLRGSGESFGQCRDGIWDLTLESRRDTLDAFATAYAKVRVAEHRELTAAEVRSLPSINPSHPLSGMWSQRAASFERFKNAVADEAPGRLVDIGAGCGWLSAAMTVNGWSAAAVDVTVDGGDGLEAALHHDAKLFLARAEMAALPFASNSIDLAVFNASLHYAGSVRAALTEAQRVVRPGGLVAVLDSPVFNKPEAGHKMVEEFERHSREQLGVDAAPLEGPGFVSDNDLAPFAFTRDDSDAATISGRVHKRIGALKARREIASRPLLISRIGDPT